MRNNTKGNGNGDFSGAEVPVTFTSPPYRPKPPSMLPFPQPEQESSLGTSDSIQASWAVRGKAD